MNTETSDLTGRVYRLIQQTQHSVFITGKAGTGKTTLLRKILANTHKNAAVVAPTGIAALNAGGVTIHSFLQIAPGAYVPDPHYRPPMNSFLKIDSLTSLNKVFSLSGAKRAVIQSLEMLIIDEVSMVRADLLDAMDFVLKKIRKNRSLFGGVQLVFFGDLYQLPPVVRPEEWEILKNYYKGMFFFQAKCLENQWPLFVELKTIYRQTDSRFIALLNNLRDNNFSEDDKMLLNRYVNPSFQLLDHPGYIFLTTHNHKADTINTQALHRLQTPEFRYKAEIEGEFPDKIFPMEEVLVLKEGAQVMFTKNDMNADKRYFNGKIGKVKKLTEAEIIVHCEDDDTTIDVDKYEWFHNKYEVNEQTKEVEEKTLGSFVHFPIKLAWAITVHKSQGLTFDKAVMDVTDVFQPGQAYVALSRLRSLDGLVLKNHFDLPSLPVSSDIKSFSDLEPDENTLKNQLSTGSKNYIKSYLHKAFDLTECEEKWKNFVTNTSTQTGNQPASVHRITILKLGDQLSIAYGTAKTFNKWLEIYFRGSDLDLPMLSQKVEGAYRHFFDILDPIEKQVLLWMTELRFAKRAKTLVQEIGELEEIVVGQILFMYKAKKLTEAWVEGKELTKDIYQDVFYNNYRKDRIEEARSKASAGKLVDEDDFGYSYIRPGKKKSTKDKTPTHEITFALWKQGKTLKEIAKERTVTLQTIENHFVKLITEKKVMMEEIISADKIRYLTKKMATYSGEETLMEVKNYLGDKVSYGEIRMYRAGKGVE